MFSSFYKRFVLASLVATSVSSFLAARQEVPRLAFEACREAFSALSRLGICHPNDISSTSCDNFQVLCLNYGQLAARSIMHRPQRFQFFMEHSRGSIIQRSECAIGGPV